MGGHAVHATAAYRAMLRTRMKSIQMILLHFRLWFYIDFRSFRLKFYFILPSFNSTFFFKADRFVLDLILFLNL